MWKNNRYWDDGYDTIEASLGTGSQPHLLSSANFSQFQSVYRKGLHRDALLEVLDGVFMAADDKQVTVLTDLDLSPTPPRSPAARVRSDGEHCKKAQELQVRQLTCTSKTMGSIKHALALASHEVRATPSHCSRQFNGGVDICLACTLWDVSAQLIGPIVLPVQVMCWCNKRASNSGAQSSCLKYWTQDTVQDTVLPLTSASTRKAPPCTSKRSQLYTPYMSK